jgi:hypothetical protein
METRTQRITVQVLAWRTIQGQEEYDSLTGTIYQAPDKQIVFRADRSRLAKSAWQSRVYTPATLKIDRVGVLTQDLDTYRTLIQGTNWEQVTIQRQI